MKCMLFLLALPTVVGSTTFKDKGDLQSAVSIYKSDQNRALAMYGPISDWDVSKITDMSVSRSA